MPTKFQNKIYSLLKKIPKGRVTTYKILSDKLGTKAYRAVGQALRCNPYAPIVSCHRVVSSDGSIGGYKGNKKISSKEVRQKIKILKKEGVEIRNSRILDFDKVLFKF